MTTTYTKITTKASVFTAAAGLCKGIISCAGEPPGDAQDMSEHTSPQVLQTAK